MSEYRFSVSNDGTIYRGRLYRLPDEWTTEGWEHYWDGDWATAFIDSGYLGGRYDLANGERALAAVEGARNYGGDEDAALKRLAVRLTGNAEADFVCVSLDRGYDLYALAWDGDPDHKWRNEIQAVYWGDTYRIEVEEYLPGAAVPGWMPDDDVCDEWYGENAATEAFEREFELAEFPAELLV